MKGPNILSTSRQDRARVLALAKPHRSRVAVLSLSAFLTGVIEAMFLVVVTRIALTVAEGDEQVALFDWLEISLAQSLVIAVVLIGVRLAFAVATALSSTQLTTSIGADLRRDLAGAYLSSSWATQQNEPSGRLLQLVTGFVPQAVGTISALTTTVNMSLNLLAMILVSVFVDPLASLAVLASLLTLATLLAPVRVRIKGRARANSESQKQYASSVAELGQMGLEMQTFGVNRQFAQRIQVLSKKVARTERRVTLLRMLMPHIFATLAYFAIVLGLIIASLVGVSELSAVGAVMLIMLRSLTYGQQLQAASSQLASSIPFLEDIDQALQGYASNAATRGTERVSTVEAIRVESISFSYSADRQALSNVSFSIAPGEVIGIIGPSGSGKSTLVQLLLGLREPTSGSIRIGDVPLSDIDRETWADLVSFVAQEPHLFTGTVAENIRFFRDHIDDAALERAAQQAHVLSDVQALPQGFDTHIGQRGVQLSGGQRQRMAIARALVGNPKFLILDEPTSALDVHSEFMIRQTIADLRGQVTVIVIAHRLSTLEMCDRLMVIEGGQLMAFEAPDKLRENSEFYRQALALSGIS